MWLWLKKCYLQFYDREITSAFNGSKMNREFLFDYLTLCRWIEANAWKTFSRARPCRLNHDGGRIELVFLGLHFKIITVDVVLLLHQKTIGPVWGLSNFLIHKIQTILPLFILISSFLTSGTIMPSI